MKTQIFCNADKNELLRISIYKDDPDDADHHALYGFFTTTLNNLQEIQSENKSYSLYNELGDDSGSQIWFTKVQVEEKKSFQEYLAGGWYINMSVAIDYTASNKDQNDPASLHYVGEVDRDGNRKKNDYERAMLQVGKILERYAYKMRFTAYGFGGKIQNETTGEMFDKDCFPVKHGAKSIEPNDVYIEGLDEMVREYRDSLKRVEFDGPTRFKPVMDHILSWVKR